MVTITGQSQQPASRAIGRRADWLGDSVISGFLATVAMTIVMALAYGVALAIGEEDGSRIERWFWALTHNPVTRTTEDRIGLAIALNLGVGLIWAIIYGFTVEHHMSGPGWLRGVRFALVPWLLSLIVFLPIMEGGVFGSDIGAGPLPVIGNLILHVVYGAVLGTIYAANPEWPEGTELDRTYAAAQQRASAIGIAVGLIVGAIGGWLLGPSLEGIAPRGVIALIGALTIGALGLLLGSFIGDGEDTDARARMDVR
ncbi:MAG TPA: DUF6789 family protein [Thermomicrobiales bacterium]